MIYDGSYSGSFVAGLAPPSGKARVVLASAMAAEPTAFLLDGKLSFSAFFWRHVLNGATVGGAFGLARQSVHFCDQSQTPQTRRHGQRRGKRSG